MILYKIHRTLGAMNSALKYSIGGTVALLLLGSALAVGVASQDTGVLAQGLSVGGVQVGGLTAEQAAAKVGAAFQAPKVTVKAADKSWTLDADKLGWSVDPAPALAQAQKATQERSLLEKLQALAGQQTPLDFPVKATVNAEQAKATLAKLTAPLSTQPKPAQIAFNNRTLKYAISQADTPGRRADAEAAANTYAANPDLTTLTLPITEWKSEQSAEKLAPLIAQGNAMMRPMTYTLSGTSRKGALSALQVANLYWVKPEGIVLDEPAIKRAFDNITGYIDQPAQNARYAWRGGKYVRVAEKAGQVTNRAAALEKFKATLVNPEVKDVTLPAQASQPTLTVAALPDPSKMQLIAVGESTYYHSSPERRTNVAVAAQKIDGAVVAPGQVFSFLNNLGGINPQNGFVGGLIISGGRTVDGLGGGVCQVSTTTFRAMYKAGLPVVERNQHSYRVGYYEPQVGFEAAVYDPGVDLKFKNDTGGTIMLKTTNYPNQSRLVIEVWGTVKPNRTVSVSRATILSRTPHPAAKYVFNPRLAPGQVKQVDWAQDGYNLYITRTIKDAQGVRSDRTSTNYKPWQAVFETGPRS